VCRVKEGVVIHLQYHPLALEDLQKPSHYLRILSQENAVKHAAANDHVKYEGNMKVSNVE
jgi:hypothetical protein